MRSPITTHVLDTAQGRPAAGLEVRLFAATEDGYRALATAKTNEDGRVTDLLEPGQLTSGDYRLVFATGGWLEGQGRDGFYPSVTIDFRITDPTQHFHVPLLLSPFGYSTYRGS